MPINIDTEETEIVEEVAVVEIHTPPHQPVTSVPTINPSDIYQKVDYYANLYNVDPWLMHHIVNEESEYNPYAVGDETYHRPSYGLAQINLYWNPEVTKEMAYDPDYALNFLARGLHEGKCHLWSTCPF